MHFLVDASKHKIRLQLLDFVGAFLHANVKHSNFVKLDRRYGKYFQAYWNYFGRPIILKKSMYGMTNSTNLYFDYLTNCMIDEAGFKHSHYQISIYYKYAPYWYNLVVLSYVDYCVYWYTTEQLGYWFVYTLANRFHANLIGYAHWFMSNNISQLKDY